MSATVSLPCPTCDGDGSVSTRDDSLYQTGGSVYRCPDCRGRGETDVEACAEHPEQPEDDCDVCRAEYRAQRGLRSPVEPFFVWAADVGLYASLPDAMEAWARSSEVGAA